jgi:ribose/xylose/arabinose/galactoside ABC-type transport system permease subunit
LKSKKGTNLILLKESILKKMGNLLSGLPAIYFSLFLLLALVIVFFIGSENFLSLYNIKVILNSSIILLAVGLGQCFVILSGGIDLSVGGIMSLVSILYIIGLEKFGLLSFPLTVIIGCAAGLLNGILYTKLRIPSFICTLGTGGIFVSISYLLSPAPLSVSYKLSKYIDLVNGSIFGIKNIWFIALIIFGLYFILQNYTYFGRTNYVIGNNEKMCWMSGVNVARSKIFAFVFSGFGSAIAGIILASTLYSGYATLGDIYVLQSIATVVIGGTALTGGVGGALNTFVGALIMGIIKNGLTVAGIDVYQQQAFLGLLIIIAVALTFDKSKIKIIK